MRAIAASTVVLILLVIPGCGGDDPVAPTTQKPGYNRSTWRVGPFPQRQFVAKADAVCKRFSEETGQLGRAFAKLRRRELAPPELNQAESQLRTAAAGLEGEDRELRRIEPPKRAYEPMAGLLDSQANEAHMERQLAAALESGDFDPLADELRVGDTPGPPPGADLESPDGIRSAFAYSLAQAASEAGGGSLSALGFRYCGVNDSSGHTQRPAD